MLFEGVAGPQIFAEVLGRNLALTRRPVSEGGRGGGFQPSELEGRIGARVLPEFFDVVDDPTQTEWRGRPLFGHYEVDREGVVPEAAAAGREGRAEELSADAAAGARLRGIERPRASAGQLRRVARRPSAIFSCARPRPCPWRI